MKNPPENWGKDPLTDFFDAARSNAFASFHQRPAIHKALVEVDSIYKALDTNDHPFVYPALMMGRGYAAYLTACELAMSTRAVECYAICRTVIENGLYGVYFSKNPAAIKVWDARHKSTEMKKEVRKTFTHGAMLGEYERLNPVWAKRVGFVYEDSIDLGAHPNTRAIHTNLKIQELDDEVSYQIHYLSIDPVVIQSALEHTLRSGIAFLQLRNDIFKARVTEDIRKRTDALSDKLSWER